MTFYIFYFYFIFLNSFPVFSENIIFHLISWAESTDHHKDLKYNNKCYEISSEYDFGHMTPVFDQQ